MPPQRRRSSISSVLSFLSGLVCRAKESASHRKEPAVPHRERRPAPPPAPCSFLLALPPELFFHVLSFLPPREIATRYRRVCKSWRELFASNAFWREICERAQLPRSDRPTDRSWEWYYWTKTNTFDRLDAAHGIGRVTWTGSRAVYEGEFKFGKREGWGRFYIKGERYEGEWVDDRKHGYGVYTWDDGDRYEGNWVAGRQEGHGSYIWGNGSSYVGAWKEDRRCGRGVYRWPQGDLYDGDFLDSHRHGVGTYTWPDGRRYEGEWRNGPRNGQGVYFWPDGSRYVGAWKDSKRHGLGCFHWADGTEWRGQWHDDMRVGCEKDPRPWDGFFRQTIDEMRRTVLSYMDQLVREQQHSSVDLVQ